MKISDVQLKGQLALQDMGGAGSADGATFKKTLEDAIEQTDDLQKVADEKMQAMAAGEPVSLHDTMIAVEKADTSMRMFVTAKNKVVQAYQEVMRMQI